MGFRDGVADGGAHAAGGVLAFEGRGGFLGGDKVLEAAGMFGRPAGFGGPGNGFVTGAGLRGGGWQGSAIDLRTVEIGGGPIEAARAAAELLARAFALPGET